MMRSVGDKRRSKKNRGGILLAALGVLGTVPLGCGKLEELESKRFSLSCGAEDQYDLYQNPINATQPVQVQIDSRFSPNEKAWILESIEEWNQFSRATRGERALFEPVEATLSSSSIPNRKNACAFLGSGEAFSIVRIDDDRIWKDLGLGPNNPAVTTRCWQSDHFVTKQVVLVNVGITRFGNGRGKFSTIIKHELGHSLGLDHSCDPSGGSAKAISCQSAALPPAYLEAIMYPTVREEFPWLNSNDKERASCILGVSH